jgi:hypothetical protein
MPIPQQHTYSSPSAMYKYHNGRTLENTLHLLNKHSPEIPKNAIPISMEQYEIHEAVGEAKNRLKQENDFLDSAWYTIKQVSLIPLTNAVLSNDKSVKAEWIRLKAAIKDIFSKTGERTNQALKEIANNTDLIKITAGVPVKTNKYESIDNEQEMKDLKKDIDYIKKRRNYWKERRDEVLNWSTWKQATTLSVYNKAIDFNKIWRDIYNKYKDLHKAVSDALLYKNKWQIEITKLMAKYPLLFSNKYEEHEKIMKRLNRQDTWKALYNEVRAIENDYQTKYNQLIDLAGYFKNKLPKKSDEFQTAFENKNKLFGSNSVLGRIKFIKKRAIESIREDRVHNNKNINDTGQNLNTAKELSYIDWLIYNSYKLLKI